MTSPRHDLAHRAPPPRFGGRALGLALGGCLLAALPLVLACQPTPHGTLNVEGHTLALIDGERHFVIRASAAAIDEASSMHFTITADADGADALTVVPDAATVTGTSVGRGSFSTFMASQPFLDAIRDGCGADGVCEMGFTVFVEPPADGTPSGEVALAIYGAAPPDRFFSDAASLELEVDGEDAVAAERGQW